MQLRDAQTSELIAEGSPLEIATAAEAFAPGEVLFDDAGSVDMDGRSRFDPAALRKARGDEITGLQAIVDAMPARAPNGDDDTAFQARRRNLRDLIKERRDRITAGKAKVAGAQQALADARERRDRAAAGR